MPTKFGRMAELRLRHMRNFQQLSVTTKKVNAFFVQAVIRIPHGGNRAERRKGKGARNEKSLAPIIKQNDERGKRMAKQKDGRYRA